MENTIREHTEVHADIRMHSPSTVILIGQYRNRDYVNIHEVHSEDFPHLVDQLRRMGKRVGRVDCPWPGLSALIEREML